MKIISSFRDYYDRHEQADPVYLRRTRPVDGPAVALASAALTDLDQYTGAYRWRMGEEWRHEVTPLVFLFCGRCVVTARRPLDSARNSFEYFDTLDDFLHVCGLKRKKAYRWSTDYAAGWERAQAWDPSPVHHACGSPVVLVEPGRSRMGYYGLKQPAVLTADVRLKDYGFGRLVGADACHQEVEQYVGGVLARPDAASVPLTDAQKVASHGFDPAWSFRNPDPPKRKRGR